MRTTKRSVVSVIAVAGIIASGFTAGTAVAASPQHGPAAAGTQDVAPLAVVNLGLSTAQAKRVQLYLRDFYGYKGAIDGQLGTASWKAMQRNLRNFGYTGAIDGVVGGGTVKALQRLLRSYGYDGAQDGVVGPQTIAAFKTYANTR
ncbi:MULTISPECIES: peptidoglycan-binding protein [Streptomyces]|uniref:Peptidoglycan binding domain-containing protein n=4 Tax=Streptomyces TaxID=1883 RepID=A0A8H9HRN8_9ACTN|nr:MULTISPECIES: peptidoglycan-binding protein [Streptomyces]NEE36502.1 peptidoglycan-binding protein [Streptomyces sp. SID7982]NEE53237.1 peptidoglycan-binding protein [Streptomyces sp. SID8455]MDQ0294026.1 lysozyme family protein [Streptomyces sp. DSM 41037]PJM82060.1 hypothetical protein CH313_19085 [Streptomyces sp. TSRI0384-2]QNE82523.1 peptidoglycan-binding protein [Streptomyces rutgersensis]